MQHPEARGVDARAPERETETLDQVRTEAKARLGRTSVQFVLIVLIAVAAAIGAVVAVIGPDRLI